MAPRSFFAIDNDNLVVTSSSSGGIVGNPIINNSSTPNGTVFTYTAGGGTTITVDDTGGDVDTFEDDNTAGHNVTDGGGIVPNGTPVEAESLIFVRALDNNGDPTGPTITITVFSQNGVTGDVWGFATDLPLQDGVSYTKTGGSNIGTSEYSSFATCFGPGTMILTAHGPRPIESLKRGDRVWTRDAGPQPIRWIGKRTIPGYGSFAPVVFKANALHNNTELTVSQEHRVLLCGPIPEVLFGEGDVLVAAKHLCGLPGVSLRPTPLVTYYHFMFDRHHVVYSNGMLSESFFLSSHALTSVEEAQRDELLTLFPSLSDALKSFGATAALSLKAHEASLLRATMARHMN